MINRKDVITASGKYVEFELFSNRNINLNAQELARRFNRFYIAQRPKDYERFEVVVGFQPVSVAKNRDYQCGTVCEIRDPNNRLSKHLKNAPKYGLIPEKKGNIITFKLG